MSGHSYPMLGPLKSRVWLYSAETWDPEHRWLPLRGSDEWGRRTIVLPIPFRGWVVIAYRKCYCGDCCAVRAETAEWAAPLGVIAP